MKRKIMILLCILTLSLTLAATVNSVRAPDGYPWFRWVNPAYQGPDPYYDPTPPYDTIVGYLEGTYWNFTLSWTNGSPYEPLNVSAIRTYFDWGKNYTYSFGTPLQIMPGETKVFNVYNMTPMITEAPELWRHYYYVYIDNVDSTTSPYKALSPILVTSNNNFAILSGDHLECLRIFTRFGMFAYIGGGIPPIMTSLPNITKAQVLFTQVYMGLTQGMQYYQVGKFDTAKGYLQSASNTFDEALNVWDERGTLMENATMDYQNAQASYYNALAGSAPLNSYGWLFLGLGWILIGIGVIIYGVRKPKTIQS